MHTAHLAQMKLSLELYASSLKENSKRGNYLEETTASCHTNGMTELSKSSRPSGPSKVFRIESKKHQVVGMASSNSSIPKGNSFAKTKQTSASSRWQDGITTTDHNKPKCPSFGIFQSQQAPLSLEATSMKAIFSSRERSPGWNIQTNTNSSPYIETLKQRRALEMPMAASISNSAALQILALRPNKKTPRVSGVAGSNLLHAAVQKASVSSSPKSTPNQLKMTGVQQLQSQLLGKHSSLANSIPPSQVKQQVSTTPSNSATPLNLGKTLCLQNGQFFSPQTSKTSITAMVPGQGSAGGSSQAPVSSMTETRKKFFINPKPTQSRALEF